MERPYSAYRLRARQLYCAGQAMHRAICYDSRQREGRSRSAERASSPALPLQSVHLLSARNQRTPGSSRKEAAVPNESTPHPLPESPNLRHLKDQAKELVRSGTAPTHADALFRVARQYGFASWPKLRSHVESLQETGRLKQAIDANDFEAVKSMMTRNPSLHRAAMGYGKNGPLTWLA